MGVSTRMLFLMSTTGDIVRTRPRWTLAVEPVPVGDGRAVDRRPVPIEPEVARAELVRRWLAAFGPGTTDDIAWWTKWTKAHVRAALAAVGAVEVSADTGDDDKAAAWVLADDLDDTPESDEPLSLLPALDSTVMGWRARGWYLGPHGPALFDRNGNAGPTVWVGGRAVGAWSQREGGEVVTAILEPVEADAAERIAVAGEQLTRWMDGVRVTPRFTNPLERSLANG